MSEASTEPQPGNIVVPDWVRDAVFYQIFPDRFANGDKTNDPDNVQKWGATPDGDHWQGGDLAGLERHLTYLKELGINALYFNPIFAARSNHGYDTANYRHIDHRFGSDEQFKALLQNIHGLGWHVILDGVFNHVGVDFPQFKDVVKRGKQSPYKDWFYINDFPLRPGEENSNYEGFKGTSWLVKLKLDNPETRAYMLDVATRWLRTKRKEGVDGWRLDAANEIPHDYWKDFRNAVKAKNPDAYIVGEIWDNAGEWLRGDEFDGVMNYRWRGATYTFMAQDEMTPTEFDATLRQMRDDSCPENACAMLNMLSSHDADRLHNRCKGDMLRVGQCVLFQMTYPGVPCIYYGDEIGMEGATDPENRRAFPWQRKQWDTGLLDFHKRLLRLRREHAVLRRGDYRTVLLHDEHRLFGFLRSYENERALVLFNTSSEKQCLELSLADIGGEQFQDWLGTGVELERNGDKAVIGLPARGMALLGVS